LSFNVGKLSITVANTSVYQNNSFVRKTYNIKCHSSLETVTKILMKIENIIQKLQNINKNYNSLSIILK